ncbi:glycosyltransferase [Streptomyces sp. NRRL S-1448]|uniref:glycosyltransferase n=1 Tax=Streptomyces sp. NRRL S-1448 TaxID=1463883 RepID=UPI00131AB907|nr:glycosyltransferase [Streptomyces sp. NRRL S-1448]
MRSNKEKRDVNFSVVIPTWNEEEWLPGLLSNLRRFPQVAEIVVADNNSIDQTRSIAQNHGARVVIGGRPAVARNAGIKYTSHDLVLFIDADAAVPASVLRRAAEAFDDGRIAAVHFPLSPIGGYAFSRVCYLLMDAYIGVLSVLGIAQGAGTFLAVRKSLFCAVGGFDETIEPGEDADLLRRLSRKGEVRYDRSAQIGTSIRRFRIENPLIFALKTCGWAALRLLKVRFSVGGYNWKPYPKGLGSKDRSLYRDFISMREEERSV